MKIKFPVVQGVKPLKLKGLPQHIVDRALNSYKFAQVAGRASRPVQGNTVRVLCGACDVVDTYCASVRLDKTFKCHHCGHSQYPQFSEHADEGDWVVHRHNQQLLPKLREALAQCEQEIAEFERAWFSCWNSTQPKQREWTTPVDVYYQHNLNPSE